ncbi:MAG: GYD domain-containing protein [Acidobacteriaceae bacterium]
MPSYLVQVSYTSASIAALVKKPQSRSDVVAVAVKKLGGTMGPFYLCFGDYDTVGIVDLPDNVSAAAFALAIAAGGSCSDVKTTPLLSLDEGMAALKKAGTSGYKPVAAK